MPIPPFERYGLLPDGIHPCTLAEVEAALAWSDRRQLLLRRFREFLTEEITPRFPEPPPMVLNGSFVTDKGDPADIDLVLLLRDLPEEVQFGGVEIYSNRVFISGRYEISIYPALRGVQQDYVEYCRQLRPQDALERGLHHRTTKGLLRLN